MDKKAEWAVLVCRDPVSRDGKWPLAGETSCWAIKLLFVPQESFLTGIYLDSELGLIGLQKE